MSAATRSAGPALAWCPFPDEESAATAVGILLDEGLAACGNIIPAMRSLYVWNGERGDTREAGLLLKTDAALLDRLVARLAMLHPYAEPAILGWRCDAASAETAAWLGSMVR